MDFNQVQELIRLVSKSKLSEFILKEGDFKLIIRNPSSHDNTAPVFVAAPPAALPVAAPPPPVRMEAAPAPAEKPAAPAAGSEAVNPNYLVIKSPMVGTFYRSAAPEKPAFIKPGDLIDKGTTVCMIEAMKLFNEIEAEIKGKIVKVLVDDGKPVEYDQPLFLVDPA